MIQIYHNPRCSKSREAVSILEDSGEAFQIINYMKTPMSKQELMKLIKKLKIKPIDLVRKNEEVWKEFYQDKKLSDSEILKAMVENPKLIERPIVVKANKAIIGRPPVLIKDLL